MTLKQHLFFSQPTSQGGAGTLYRLREMGGRYEIAASLIYSFKPTTGCCGPHMIVNFIIQHRTKDEPPVFEILRDLFPGHKEALDRVEVEILRREFEKAVNQEGVG